MQVLLVAGLGVSAVLVTILVIRLHPFLSLLLGSVIVLVLTPESCHLLNQLDSHFLALEEVSADGNLRLSRPPLPGEYRLWRSQKERPEVEIWQLQPVGGSVGSSDSDWYQLTGEGSPHSARFGDRLILNDRYVQSVQQASADRFGSIVERLSIGLSSTFQKIGLAIAMAAIIGVCLLESGAAQRIVEGLSSRLGEQRTAPVLVISGFVLGIPIFFDTVFYLLLPLAKAFSRLRPGQGLLAVMSIIVGATMAHSLIPPTPGPLLVASQLEVPIGAMMLGGTVVGAITTTVGYLYSRWCNKKWSLPEEYTNTTPSCPSTPSASQSSAAQSILAPPSGPGNRFVIPLSLAVAPLAFPIISLGGIELSRSLGILNSLESHSQFSEAPLWGGIIKLLGQPGFVLMVSAAMAYGLLRRVVSAGQSLTMLSRAIADAGTILLLTCAGGAFGTALEDLRLAEVISTQLADEISPSGLLLAVFGFTALIRIAQGSATVAMITAVAVVAPIVHNQLLPYHPVYVALAIGCGAKLLPWMNDSGFWQVSTMTGMGVQQTFKTFSAVLTLMGCTGLIVILIGATWLPLR